MKRFFQRAYHFLERIYREGKVFPERCRAFGWEVAIVTFFDGLFPPGKTERYVNTIEKYVENYLKDMIRDYKPSTEYVERTAKILVWCCWWQGEDSMPELVKLCHTRLKQVLPEDKAELHLITLDNYQQYVDIPKHIIKKYEDGIITMTTMSDVLRFQLLYKYGGYWLDSTLFFSGDIPEEYFTEQFFCQRMADPIKCKREACKGNWCGFSMAGKAGLPVFDYMNKAFSKWWEDYNLIIDYVLIDYLLMQGYKHIPEITDIINQVPDNNEDIFAMYTKLNQPYSDELYKELTKRNVMHKLTYKMDLYKETEDGQQTLYGYLHDMVYGNRG